MKLRARYYSQKIFTVDFDGTCVKHEYPRVGPDVPDCVDVLRLLTEAGAKLILWTMRSGTHLDAAVGWFNEHNIPLYGVNENPAQRAWTQSPKAYAHLYIGDDALGCPLVVPRGCRPYVDWPAIKKMLQVVPVQSEAP